MCVSAQGTNSGEKPPTKSPASVPRVQSAQSDKSADPRLQIAGFPRAQPARHFELPPETNTTQNYNPTPHRTPPETNTTRNCNPTPHRTPPKPTPRGTIIRRHDELPPETNTTRNYNPTPHRTPPETNTTQNYNPTPRRTPPETNTTRNYNPTPRRTPARDQHHAEL